MWAPQWLRTKCGEANESVTAQKCTKWFEVFLAPQCTFQYFRHVFCIFYCKVSFKRSRLYRCLRVSTRHFSTPFDKLRNTQGFSSYPTGMLRLHQTHVESLQACEEDRFFASVVTWKWMKQHPIKNHGGLVAVGVDADLFDKVAEKLATSGDLEKALDFGVLEYGWLQYFNAFRSLASTSPTGLRGAEGPLLLCPE